MGGAFLMPLPGAQSPEASWSLMISENKDNLAMKICTMREPDIQQIGDGHEARCFLFDKEVVCK